MREGHEVGLALRILFGEGKMYRILFVLWVLSNEFCAGRIQIAQLLLRMESLVKKNLAQDFAVAEVTDGDDDDGNFRSASRGQKWWGGIGVGKVGNPRSANLRLRLPVPQCQRVDAGTHLFHNPRFWGSCRVAAHVTHRGGPSLR